MSSRINQLTGKVEKLYRSKNVGRDEWSDWIFDNHVLLVSSMAEKLSKRYGANSDLAVAAGLLHDIADVVMSRFDKEHEEESLRIAKKLLIECKFTDEEIGVVLDALKMHGCYNGEKPSTLEGRIMAAADAVVHLKSSFYDYAIERKKETQSVDDISVWGLNKIKRDFYNKIAFEDLRDEVKKDYVQVKDKFLNLK